MHNPYAPPAAEINSVPAAPEQEEDLQYAGFWRRFGSYWIDVVVLLPLAGIGYLLAQRFRLFYGYWLLPSVLIGLWFHVYLVARYGGTPGKLLLRTRIAMVSGAAITARAAALRYAVLGTLSVGSSIALVIAAWHMTDQEYFSLGYLERSQRLIALAPSWYRIIVILSQIWIWGEFVTMMFNKRRRAVHDFIAGTVVVQKVKLG